MLFYDQIKEVEVGGACRTHGKEERCVYNFSLKPELEKSRGRPVCMWYDDHKVLVV